MQKTILIVEDNFDQRELLTLVLTDSDYCVVEAASVKEAEVHLGKCKPDLIITDLTMPDFDGRYLIERIKNNPDLKEIPIMVLSAIVDEEEDKKLRESGVVAFLDKTTSRKHLLSVISVVLANVMN